MSRMMCDGCVGVVILQGVVYILYVKGWEWEQGKAA